MFIRPPEAIIKELREGQQESFREWLNQNSVTDLDLDKVFLNQKQAWAASAATTVVQSGVVCALLLNDNDLEQYAIIIADILTAPHSVINYLELSENNIGEHGPAVAANLTRPGSQLNTLVMRLNNLAEHGPATVANLIGPHSKIKRLCLAFNSLKQHAISVAAHLASNSSPITEVDLSHNALASYGPDTAANLAKPGSPVVIVDLSWNQLSQYGPLTATRLTRDGLGSQIQFVNFNFNGLKSYGPVTLKNLIGPNSRIYVLDFRSNFMSNNDKKKCKDHLELPESPIVKFNGQSIENSEKKLKDNFFRQFKNPNETFMEEATPNKMHWLSQQSQPPTLLRLALAANIKSLEQASLENQRFMLEKIMDHDDLNVPFLLFSGHLKANELVSDQAPACIKAAKERYIMKVKGPKDPEVDDCITSMKTLSLET